jgi:hypothetical protein
MARSSAEKFLAEVKKDLRPAHEKFLAMVKETASELWADFNATGSDDKDYQVKSVGIDRHILRIGASGKLFAFWGPLKTVGPDAPAVLSDAMKPWVKKSSNKYGSRFELSIGEIYARGKLRSLLEDLKAVSKLLRIS